jgi:RNA methyltransferase, TrmH family
MPVRVIESMQNARLKELRKALAASGRSEGGRVGIEGPKMLEEAVRARLRVAAAFVAQGSERLIEAIHLPPETEILRLPKKLLAAALATETPQPVAALVEPPQWTWEHVLGLRRKTAPLVIVFAGVQDPGNLGTILRSAEAFGATGVVSLPGTVSAWNPKAVRASAGSVFRVPLLAASEKICLERLREAGVTILATAMCAAQPADLADMAEPVALMIGNEGNGVADELAAKADGNITIPCPGPVESLNAAVAASVLLYEAARQRAGSVPHPFSAASSRAEERMGHRNANRGERR